MFLCDVWVFLQPRFVIFLGVLYLIVNVLLPTPPESLKFSLYLLFLKLLPMFLHG
jgi:hypothetical protein